MSLGLLAKDSIQDLESLGRDVAEQTTKTKDAAATDWRGAGRRGSNTATNRPRRSSRTATNEANPQQPPSFQYAGFLDDYNSYSHPADDQHLYGDHDLFAGPSSSAKESGGGGGLLFCLFPWMQKPKSTPTILPEEPEDHSAEHAGLEEKKQEHQEEGKTSENEEKEDAETSSTNSNLLGEKLSERDRQAVLARLRLAQPEENKRSSNNLEASSERSTTISATHSGDNTNNNSNLNKKGLLNGIPVYDTSPLDDALSPEDEDKEEAEEEEFNADGTKKLKGILKKRCMVRVDDHIMKNGVITKHPSDVMDGGGSNHGKDQQRTQQKTKDKPRRSLFPSYEDRSSRSRNQFHITFAPMARVVTVKSKNDMMDEEKADIWWHKSDYEDFRKTGRIITRAMLEGGSHIWLASFGSKEKGKSSSSSQSGDTAKVTGNNWWHKFGHSRRGLEHVVSIEEGRQRQANVKNAIRAVLDEQVRQKMYRREDVEKLRNVALHHTHWARDLALASGASDADAVDSSFANNRRSREYYLIKLSKSSPSGVKRTERRVPAFMQPALHTGSSAATAVPSNRGLLLQQRLDANTAAQIQFRRRRIAPAPSQQQQDKQMNKESTAETPTKEETETKTTEAAVTTTVAEETTTADKGTTKTSAAAGEVISEPVHDPDPNKKESLAHQAAGFSTPGEKVNVAAVLSGMGAGLSTTNKDKLTSVSS